MNAIQFAHWFTDKNLKIKKCTALFLFLGNFRNLSWIRKTANETNLALTLDKKFPLLT